MIVSIGMRVVDCWSGVDGEQYVVEQGQVFDNQQQSQKSFDQDKYNFGLSMLPIHL
jgi:hypothetical protein